MLTEVLQVKKGDKIYVSFTAVLAVDIVLTHAVSLLFHCIEQFMTSNTNDYFYKDNLSNTLSLEKL